MLQKLFRKILFFFKIFHVYKVKRHKKKLAYFSKVFNNYPEVLFVIQLFNKGRNSKKILSPLLGKKVKNIVAFADGCIDNSADLLHKEMKGANHIVLQVNDVHEIKNYRLSLDIAKNLNCKYVFLMQDDDIYEESIFNWIDKGINVMNEDKISIIGGNSGANYIEDYNYGPIENIEKFNYSKFKTFINKNSEKFYEIEGFFKFKIPNVKSSKDFLNYEFVCTVNRAPQLINVNSAKSLNFFPKELEPFQYDDYYNCLNAWENGYKILLAPFSQKITNEVGGMRLYNNISKNKRGNHFYKNYNFVISKFQDLINSGRLNKLINEANENISSYH